MIDPFTAVAAATTAFNTVKKFVHAGQEFENVMGQMGKWYTSVSDFRKGQQLQKKIVHRSANPSSLNNLSNSRSRRSALGQFSYC